MNWRRAAPNSKRGPHFLRYCGFWALFCCNHLPGGDQALLQDAIHCDVCLQWWALSGPKAAVVLPVQPHREDTVHSLILIGPARRHALNFVYLFNILKMGITMDKKLYMRVPLFCGKSVWAPVEFSDFSRRTGQRFWLFDRIVSGRTPTFYNSTL